MQLLERNHSRLTFSFPSPRALANSSFSVILPPEGTKKGQKRKEKEGKKREEEEYRRFPPQPRLVALFCNLCWRLKRQIVCWKPSSRRALSDHLFVVVSFIGVCCRRCRWILKQTCMPAAASSPSRELQLRKSLGFLLSLCPNREVLTGRGKSPSYPLRLLGKFSEGYIRPTTN